jgi:hypothetical protein
VLPAFKALIKKWQEYQIKHFEVSSIIEDGLIKLEFYENHTELTLAYSFVMSIYAFYDLASTFLCYPVVDPSIKWDWYWE